MGEVTKPGDGERLLVSFELGLERWKLAFAKGLSSPKRVREVAALAAAAVWRQTPRVLPGPLPGPAGTFFSRQGQLRQPAPDGTDTDADSFLSTENCCNLVWVVEWLAGTPEARTRTSSFAALARASG